MTAESRGRVLDRGSPSPVGSNAHDGGRVHNTCVFNRKPEPSNRVQASYRRGARVATDPVCGMSVDEKTTKMTSTHDGRTFYFCSASCKETFDNDPHRYGHGH